MGITDFFKKRGVSEKTAFILTPLGKGKIEKSDTPGAKYRVLLSLYENQPSTIEELANDTNMSTEQVKALLKGFSTSGYVRQVSGQEG